LKKQQLTEKLLTTINAHLKEQGLLVSQGTLVDATIIHAPTSVTRIGIRPRTVTSGILG